MPLYEYVCRTCGNDLESLQKFSDPPLTDCPECGAAALVKKISAAGFRLKGGGWYETDFKQDKRRNVVGDSAEGKKADSGDTGSGGATTGKGESKAGESESKGGKKPEGASGGKDSAGNKKVAGE